MIPDHDSRGAASRNSLRRLNVAVDVGREVIGVACGGRRDLGEEFPDVLGRYPITEQRRDLVVRDPRPGNDRFAAADPRIDLDVLPWFQQAGGW